MGVKKRMQNLGRDLKDRRKREKARKAKEGRKR